MLLVGAAHDIEALGVGLHDAVLDTVVHNLDEVTGPRRTAVEITFFGRAARVGFDASRGTLDIAHSRGERLEDRIEMLNGVLLTADHHAVTALDAPDATARADVDVVNALLGQSSGATDVVFVVLVAAGDDHVAFVEMFGDGVDRVLGGVATRNHDPDGPRCAYLADHVFE